MHSGLIDRSIRMCVCLKQILPNLVEPLSSLAGKILPRYLFMILDRHLTIQNEQKKFAETLFLNSSESSSRALLPVEP